MVPYAHRGRPETWEDLDGLGCQRRLYNCLGRIRPSPIQANSRPRALRGMVSAASAAPRKLVVLLRDAPPRVDLRARRESLDIPSLRFFHPRQVNSRCRTLQSILVLRYSTAPATSLVSRSASSGIWSTCPQIAASSSLAATAVTREARRLALAPFSACAASRSAA